MNIDAFNAAFPSFEKTFLEEEKIRKQNEKELEENKRRIKFMEQFPENILFNDLKKQKDNIITNDGCVHYQHIYNGKIYSWMFRSNKNEWFIKDDMSDVTRAKLFS
jgi:hypothetical protein